VTDFKQYLGAKDGKEEDLMPDFFLDEFLEVEQQGLGEIVNSVGYVKVKGTIGPKVVRYCTI
jgi:hypothetical protein